MIQKIPYKFLDSYSREDRDIFFGRDKEIEELHSRVFQSKILVVYGTSGTGKSSLINCGLANKFNDSDWLPVNVRRGSDINRSLTESLERTGFTEVPTGKKDSAKNGGRSIVKLIQSIYLDNFKPVYLIFDQFEELFIFGTAEEKEKLISNVKKVVDSDLQCRFIFSIREEYLAGFTEFEKVIPSFLDNRIRIEKMTRQNATQVIDGPCRLTGIDVEPGFSELLLEKLNPGNPEVELTYLQVYIDRIFRLASQQPGDPGRFTVGLIEEAGEVKDLLGNFLEEQIAQLDDPESGLVVLKSFVSVKGTKLQITEYEVIEYSKTFGKDLDPDLVKDLVQKFIRLRILRDKDENGRYELRHDSLATKIYEKITLVEKELLEIRQFLENLYSSFERRQLYLTADDLKYIAPYEDKLFLSEKLLRFIAGSKRNIQKARRRRQNVLIITGSVLIAVLSFFTIWALRERGNAVAQQKIADVQKNDAVAARMRADSASVVAQANMKLAIEKESQAVHAQRQSEEARRQALAQREYALKQKGIADQLSVEAGRQAQIANDEKVKAEQERAKAVAAEAEAKRLGLLSIAQNLALKSMSMENDPQLMGLLAVQAYKFNRDNGGYLKDPVIFEALHRAWTVLDSSKHQAFKGSPNEIRTMAMSNGALLTADLDGVVRKWNEIGSNKIDQQFSVNKQVDFIKLSPSGRYLLYWIESSSLSLKIRVSETVSEMILIMEPGSILSASFSEDEKNLAVSTSDSLVYIWSIDENKIDTVGRYKLNVGPAQCIEFCGIDTISVMFNTVVKSDDQYAISSWNYRLFSMDPDIVNSGYYFTPRPLTIAYNKFVRTLFVGCSNGEIAEFNLNLSGSTPFSWFYYKPFTSGIDHIKFSNDNSVVAISTWDRSLRICDGNKFFTGNDMVLGTYLDKNIKSRTRAILFDNKNKLYAAFGDKSIRVWETSLDRLFLNVCRLITTNLSQQDWINYIGEGIPYQSTCGEVWISK
jgi:hypothetical protein